MTSNIKLVIFLPSVIGFLFLLSGIIIGQEIFKLNKSDIYLLSITAFSLTIIGFSGLIQIIRKEGIGFFGKPVKGVLPIINGCLLLFITWGSALYLVFLLFQF